MNFFKAKIGLALGGGGARGAAHLGVLRQLEIAQLIPFCIAGTSAGSVVASLYCFGIPLEVITKEMKKLKPIAYSSFQFKGLGLFENTELKNLLEKLLPKDALIENAKIPLAIKATNIQTGHGVILDRGPVIPAVLASCCVPGIYTPQLINGLLLVDGGLTENVPLTAIKHLGARIRIGVNLNGNQNYLKPENAIDVVTTAMDIAIDVQTQQQLKGAHITISMDLTQYSRTSSTHFDQLIKVGQAATEAAIGDLAVLRVWIQIRKAFMLLRDLIPIKIPRIISNYFKSE